MVNKENLQKVIDTMPENLVSCYYVKNDCYCVLGHMMNVAGIDVNKIAGTKSNEKYVNSDDAKLTKLKDELVAFYGLDVKQLTRLQEINDNSLTVERAERLKLHLTALIEYQSEVM